MKHNSFSLFLHMLSVSVFALLFLAGIAGELRAEGGKDDSVTTFRVITPPDPNFIPMSVLRAKAGEWMPGVEVELVMVPSGDPSTMRAMLYSRAADFALFSVPGGSRFVDSGITNLSLVGVHVWKGVHLLAQESVGSVRELDGQRLIAVPAVMTPSHMVAKHALHLEGVNADFTSGRGGPVLMARLSSPGSAPLGFVAPEPMVSIILRRQQKENWPVRYKVLMDLQAVASPRTGETPLGGLWVVEPGRVRANKDAARTFVDGFRRAVDYADDPRHVEEVADIVSGAMKEVYGQRASPAVYRSMLKSPRLRLDFRDARAVEKVVVKELKRIYGVVVDEKVFRSVF
ncbi:ABC transporter substrate-binding protein [Prosthecochloris sp. ZM_2]|nr:ABC transporter substrate-binding protein [Prosthecochloris sp. ZM_2]